MATKARQTHVGTGFRSVNEALRQDSDLFAAVRPARSLPAWRVRHHGLDLVVIRENTEDLYQGIEFETGIPSRQPLREEPACTTSPASSSARMPGSPQADQRDRR